ncbi:MAG: putative metallocarboxypeptidase ecm14 [Thelocarpon superellum]|nr:MAG: putative metallocarboxypeptidase ecm14 [Thelocarpon superellum]
MHLSSRLIAVLVAALCSLVFLSSFAVASPSGRGPTRDRPFPAPTHFSPLRSDRSSDRRPWAYLRDKLIQCVFRLPTSPPIGPDGSRTVTKSGGSQPPADLLARYGGDVVLRFNISTAGEAKALAEATNVLFLDVWEVRDDWVDIRLAKDVIPSLLGLLPPSLHHAHTPLMHDLAQAIYDSYPAPALDEFSPTAGPNRHAFSPTLHSSAPSTENLFFRDYQPLSVIAPWMRLMASLFPTHVRMINIGVSYEGRDIPALRIGVHPTNSQQARGPRRTIIISAGSHAREWISVSTVNYVAYTLITEYGKTPSVTKLLEEFDWVLVPTINPDGYVYSWENDRLWRKNRQQTSLRFCRGLDLDRSWGYQWDGEASRGNPCSESYPGEHPFEAVESRRFSEWVRNEVEQNNVKIAGFLDLHSYSQQVLYPYSYSCGSSPPSLENLEELALGLAKSIRRSAGEHYAVTSACEGSISVTSKSRKTVHPRMETGGGSALDWFYHEMRARYAYQIKLRDTGSYGFLLPKDNILPTGQEAVEAVKYFGRFLMKAGGQEMGEDMEAYENEQDPDEDEDEEDGEWVKVARPSSFAETREKEDAHWAEEDEGGEKPNWELKRRRRR